MFLMGSAWWGLFARDGRWNGRRPVQAQSARDKHREAREEQKRMPTFGGTMAKPKQPSKALAGDHLHDKQAAQHWASR